MRFCHTLPLVLVLGLGACSGDSAKEITFTDPIAALDQADAASASGDSATAQAGYDYALANGDAKLQGEALLGMVELNIAEGKEDDASTAFERLSGEFASQLNGDLLARLCDAAALAKLPNLGDMMVEYTVANFPEVKEKLQSAATAFERIRTEGPDADLSDLGYAGD